MNVKWEIDLCQIFCLCVKFGPVVKSPCPFGRLFEFFSPLFGQKGEFEAELWIFNAGLCSIKINNWELTINAEGLSTSIRSRWFLCEKCISHLRSRWLFLFRIQHWELRIKVKVSPLRFVHFGFFVKNAFLISGRDDFFYLEFNIQN